MNVLVIGSGGREHALAWKLKQSPRIEKLFIAPGNAGTAQVGENVAIGVMEFDKLTAFARENKIDFTIVGPDDPLVAGIVDAFQASGLRVWGPSKAAAQIEGSKAFAKALMQEAGVPTARFNIFSDFEAARDALASYSLPVVVKASGLALGKGVYICQTKEEAEAALAAMMVEKVFKDAGSEVVIEEFLVGPEVSIHALCDGTDFILFPPSQDHKAIFDGNKGPNTGGMGTIAPLPFVTDAQMQEMAEKIVHPTLEALARRGAPFKGLLYPGLILTADGPKTLEFNARFGDPETQVYMRLLESDLLDLLEASESGTIKSVTASWKPAYAANIVLASGGYPGEYKKGVAIAGVDDATATGAVVFHAGTKREGEQLVTNGGRVFGVSAVGVTLKEALDNAYAAADKIIFDGKQLRRDVGAKSL